jgi:hypothetical protein
MTSGEHTTVLPWFACITSERPSNMVDVKTCPPLKRSQQSVQAEIPSGKSTGKRARARALASAE